MDLDPEAMEKDIDREFLKDVDKHIVEEAPTHAWSYPHPGDLVAVELVSSGASAGGDAPDAPQAQEMRSWVVGGGVPHNVGGVDLDRCSRTMRRGEVASVKRRGGDDAAAILRLRGLECSDDLTGDGQLTRITVERGATHQSLRRGTELHIRYSWRQALDGSAGAGTATVSEAPLVTEIVASPGAGAWKALAESRDVADFTRALLRRFGGTVVLRREPDSGEAEGDGTITIRRAGKQLFRGSVGTTGIAEALRAVQGAGDESVPQRQPREVVVRVLQEHLGECSAEDWIPGDAGMRVLTGLAAGSRCLVRVAPNLAFGDAGLPSLGVPPGATLDYDVEILKVLQLEDVSLDQAGGVMKKTLRQGEGYHRPTEGTEVTMKIEARDNHAGAVLLNERQVTFVVGSGTFCSAVEDTAMTMARSEACEVLCSDPLACTDSELGLTPRDGDVLVLSLELLDFKHLEIYSLEEVNIACHCNRVKDAGSKFFQQGAIRRALKRYQFVTSTLAYLEHWKDSAAQDKARTMRRACHLNIAACWLKLERWEEAAHASCIVLEEEPDNVKALFRAGRAQTELGNFREAEQKLRKLLELDRDNKEVARFLARARQGLRSDLKQSRAMFSRMARGIGEGDREGEGTPTQTALAADAAATAGAEGAERPATSAAKDRSPSAPATFSDEASPSAAPGVATALLVVSSLLAFGAAAILLSRRWRGSAAGGARYQWLS